MPKLVDHDQRRRQITDALIQVAATSGLHQVTMRKVAAQAGVSVRLVQYFFTDKASLMMAALEHLTQQSNDRWTRARDQAIDEEMSVRHAIEAFLAAAAVDDRDSRVFQLVWTSYATMAMTDPGLAARPFIDGPDRVEAELVELLELAANRDELATRSDGTLPAVAIEAARILTLNHGLGTSVLIGQKTPEQAAAILRYHLDGLFDR
ncbi:TetR/AcrR family transcriptional regulator [Janibacter alittae]|uniref:TetR family transcriptional regulator C-terminal domain-containing protein n=1 Tax=Janibacter alittae TaxID=3115209 RepID=A0ABZ2MGZ6_9MICO